MNCIFSGHEKELSLHSNVSNLQNSALILFLSRFKQIICNVSKQIIQSRSFLTQIILDVYVKQVVWNNNAFYDLIFILFVERRKRRKQSFHSQNILARISIFFEAFDMSWILNDKNALKIHFFLFPNSSIQNEVIKIFPLRQSFWWLSEESNKIKWVEFFVVYMQFWRKKTFASIVRRLHFVTVICDTKKISIIFLQTRKNAKVINNK